MVLPVTGPTRSRRPASPAFEHLQRDSTFQALAPRLELLQRTQRTLDEHWPTFGLSIQAVRHESLLILTPNAAVAAKCRQIEPSLIERLKPLFPGLVSVRFRPRPAAPARPERPSHKLPIGPAGLAAIDRQLAALPAGTVRDKLAKMISHHRNSGESS